MSDLENITDEEFASASPSAAKVLAASFLYLGLSEMQFDRTNPDDVDGERVRDKILDRVHVLWPGLSKIANDITATWKDGDDPDAE